MGSADRHPFCAVCFRPLILVCGVLAVRKEDKKQLFATLGTVGNIGFTMVSTVAVGLFLGRMADKWMDSSPWFSVAGIVLGMISGMWAMYKKAAGK